MTTVPGPGGLPRSLNLFVGTVIGLVLALLVNMLSFPLEPLASRFPIWEQLAVGLLLILALVALSVWLEHRNVLWAAITIAGLAAVIVALLISLVQLANADERSLPVEATGTAAPAATGTAAPAAIATPTGTPRPCPFAGGTAVETMTNLINAEAEAANTGDLALIDTIYAPDAVIADAKGGLRYGARAHYEPLFASLSFSGVAHFDLQLAGPGIVGDVAYLTSGSRGQFSTAGGEAGSFENPPPSDQWVFRKDGSGCWTIAALRYNAAHLPFPG